MAAPSTLAPSPVNVRIKISALWAAVLFVFVYVDLFSTYRADIRADIAAGELGGFTIGDTFLFITTAYIAIPSLMVFLALVLRPRLARAVNIVLAVVYSLTIIGGAIGEWNYYVLGSAIEVVLLAAVAFYAWTWPRLPSTSPAAGSSSDAEPELTAQPA